MATLREAALLVADKVRALTAPGILDYRTVAVTIISRTWGGGEAGADGGSIDTVLLQLPQQYRVVEITEREIASSGGRYDAGSMRVGPITPSYSVDTFSGGATPDQLDPARTDAQTGVEIIYVLSGAINGEYRLARLHEDRAVSYYLDLNRTRVTP